MDACGMKNILQPSRPKRGMHPDRPMSTVRDMVAEPWFRSMASANDLGSRGR